MCFCNPRGTNFISASRDLLLPELSMFGCISFCTLTTPSCRNPRGTNFISASRDLLLPALSMFELRYHV